MLANPVPHLHVIRMRVLGKSGRPGLFRREKPLLLLGNLKQAPRGFTVRLSHKHDTYNFFEY
jgi:hypothetical protein